MKKKNVKDQIEKLFKKEMTRIFNQESEDTQSKRDMGLQLDGVLRDVLSWWENVKY